MNHPAAENNLLAALSQRLARPVDGASLGGFRILFGLVMVLVMRHHLYPGSVFWNDEGFRFSWFMKTRSKVSLIAFYVTDPATDETWLVDARQHLTGRQLAKMSTSPDMIMQFVDYIERELEAAGQMEDPIIRVEAVGSLNGRPLQLFIDPEVDLSEEQYGGLFDHATWVMPIEFDVKGALLAENQTTHGLLESGARNTGSSDSTRAWKASFSDYGNILEGHPQSGPLTLRWLGWGIGEELAALVLATVVFSDVDIADAHRLDKIVFDGYLEGLAEAGWHGDPRLARLGYTASSPLIFGLGHGLFQFDSTLFAWYEQAFGRPIDEIMGLFAESNHFLLELADEARRLLAVI